MNVTLDKNAPYGLYMNCDFIQEFNNFLDAADSFYKTIEKYPTSEIDVLIFDGRNTSLSYGE